MDRVPKQRFDRKVKFPNMLMPRLIGVNIAPGEPVEVIPVYIPFLRWEPGDGQLLIELAMWTDNAWVILLYSRWPFVYITRGGGVNLSERDIY
jgi:hypothetical protein